MKDIFLLDMDDTLLDFERAEHENFFRTLAQFSVAADEELYASYHAVNDGLWKALERGELERERLKTLRFELLFSEFRINADASAVASRYYVNFADLCFPFEGAAEFLRELSMRGRAYIVTNGGTQIQRSHIALAGFERYLAGTFISEEVGANKPSQEFANAVMVGIDGFDAERAVLLGDSLTSDMGCAKSLNTDFVLFLPRTVSAQQREASPRTVSALYMGPVAHSYEEALSLMK